MQKYFLGVDVGTQSVRCALVDSNGILNRVVVEPIQIWSPRDGFYQQSSEEIWRKICCACKDVITASKISKNEIVGIGFDATCSMVVLDKQFHPLTIDLTSAESGQTQNVIMWMDHRAHAQAELINSRNYESLKCVGGKISLEMQAPKLLWLKENMGKKWWGNAGHFMDLPDYLTWRATKSLNRSLCSVTCKWLYSAKGGWDRVMWSEIGLSDVIDDPNYVILEPGKACGAGLTAQSALEMGLNEGTAVGASLIDAYSGALGLLACQPNMGIEIDDVSSKLAVICGTSTCHIAVSRDPKFVGGVWGPYFSVLVPGLWTNEGGQSVTGKLLDHIITTHPVYSQRDPSQRHLSSMYGELHEVLEGLRREKNLASVTYLTNNLHVYPDFHGNRSPLADSALKGMICGLTLNSGVEELAVHYLATVQALAYSTKQIICALESHGHSFRCIFMCGGLANNDLYVKTHADVTGLPIIRPSEPESVLIGSAMLGAVASGRFSSLDEAMAAMGGRGDVTFPREDTKIYHRLKYEIYEKMLENQREYDQLMNSVECCGKFINK